MMARRLDDFTTGRIYDCIRSQSLPGSVFSPDIREESLYEVRRRLAEHDRQQPGRGGPSSCEGPTRCARPNAAPGARHHSRAASAANVARSHHRLAAALNPPGRP
jgi:hypothetical protein